MNKRPDTQAVLDQLKDFQRSTVDYVFHRFHGENPTRRFLVADEVGLGKTLVARGVIARTIDHLWQSKKRIDVIYVCSNADIASQNIKRLGIPGCNPLERSTRLTLLALEIDDLESHRVNFIALTPSTSFEQNKHGGKIRERALLYLLLKKAWRIQESKEALNVLCGFASVKSFQQVINNLEGRKVNQQLEEAFLEELRMESKVKKSHGEKSLKTRFDELCILFHRANARMKKDDLRVRSEWLGDMRRLLARVSLEAIKPDLVIFDEFQRYNHLLDKDSEAGALAHALLDSNHGARLLLLSATPYKSVSLHHEKDSDAPNEFVTLVESLEESKDGDFAKLLAEYRCALLAIRNARGLEAIREARDKIEARLRKVMVRTEKSVGTSQSIGMLTEHSAARLSMTANDIRAYLGTQAIAENIQAGDMVEYWKSSPYLFNFMEKYVLKQVFKTKLRDPELIRMVNEKTGAFLPMDSIHSYRRIDPANGRLRALEDETVGRGMWRLLWMPPSLGYYKPSGPYAEKSLSGITKRLVFSSWHVVPRAVASLLSYEAERRIICGLSPNGRPTMELWQKQKALLHFSEQSGRLTGLPLFNFVYPCLTFATHFDPRDLETDHCTAKEVIRIYEKRLRQMSANLKIRSIKEGRVDERWYWIMPMLMDAEFFPEESHEWWKHRQLASQWAESGKVGTDAWAKHVLHARDTFQEVLDGSIILGPRPDDLFEVLALTASAGPATAALRSLSRRSSLPVHGCQITRFAAAQVAWAFLSLFNHPEVNFLIRAEIKSGPYWRRVLAYVHGGQIQAVLDEYVHVLVGSVGGSALDFSKQSKAISEEMSKSIALRAAPLTADHIVAQPNARAINISYAPMRLRFAMRFGEEKEEDSQDTNSGGKNTSSRKERVRAAFNSPFWPFVLVSTSVGQEGLDFHHYCHAITHWNLPANPVDLEQREGRIHRYKGHAIRKNVAAMFGAKALKREGRDPWTNAFELAIDMRRPHDNDLVPYWHFPGAAMIERHVSALPLSRELDRIEALRKALVVYRMVLGQNRQEDLITYILSEIPEADHAAVVEELRINLSPPIDF